MLASASRGVSRSRPPVDCSTMPTRLRQLEAGPLRVGAEHAHVTGVAVAEALGDLDGGRLAGAVRAEQGEALAGADVEVEPVDGGPPP